MVRRAAPGDRVQGIGADQRGNPDCRDDHDSELLQDVQAAGGHDGHRRHRGPGVPRHLQARRRVDPDQQAGTPRRPRARHLPLAARQVERDRRGDQGVPRHRPPDADRHDKRREEREAQRDAVDALRDQARGAQRQARQGGPRGRDRRAGRSARVRHDLDEHGRPRHGHQAGHLHPRTTARALAPPRARAAHAHDRRQRGATPRAGLPQDRPDRARDQQARDRGAHLRRP